MTDAANALLDTIDSALGQAAVALGNLRQELNTPEPEPIPPSPTDTDVPEKRSGRPIAGGVTYWADQFLPNYERQVAFLDCGGGASHYDYRGVATWDLLIGGPKAAPDTIVPNSQLDVQRASSTNFGSVFDAIPDGKGWYVWVLSTVPTTNRTDRGDPQVWRDVAAGRYDDEYQVMGSRIAKAGNMQSVGS